MRITLILIFGSFMSIASFSQENKSFQTIKELTDSIKVIMQKEHIVGLMVGIATKDSVLFSGGFGYADLEAKRPVDENTLFRMGSITKMFVSLGIMKLIEEGKLNLNDALKQIAPEVPFKNNWESTHPVRIIHLLEHTTGFDDVKLNAMYSLSSDENQGIEMMLVHKNSMVCRWKPGERTAYANPNYAILGYIIEKLSGKPYDEYLTELILNPLGMKSSNFNLNTKLPEDVKEYIFKDGQIKLVPSVTLLSGPQGALWSSSDDMIKFLQLFLRDGDPLFSERVMEEIETSRTSLGAQAGLTSCYALGNSVTFLFAKEAFRGHRGLTGTCHSGCYYKRDRDVGFVVASNSNNANFAVENLIVSFLEQTIPDRKLSTQPLDETAITPYLGFYEFGSPRNEIASIYEKFQNTQHIYIENGVLRNKRLFDQPGQLLQTSPLTFTWSGMNTPLIVFTENEEGKPVMSIGGTYYEKSSYPSILLKRVVLIVSVVFTISSVVLGIVSLIGATVKRIKWKDAIMRILPSIGLLLLLWAVYRLFELQEFSYQLAYLETLNTFTIMIFFCTTAFGIISVITFIYAINIFRKTQSRSFAWYMLITSTSYGSLAFVLLQHGWIGLRTWAM